MTMPHMMNCPHTPAGWCLMCVVKLGNENMTLAAALSEVVAVNRRAMYERCPDCDKPHCDRDTGCLSCPLSREGEIAKAALDESAKRTEP